MRSRTDGLDVPLPDDPRTRLLVAGWLLAAACVLLQGAVEHMLSREAVTGEFLLRWRLLPIALWGAATPLVLALARRWPVPGAGWPRHLLAHGLFFSAWMVVSNVLLRAPDLLDRALADIGREAMAAAVDYAPAGALAWALIVAVERGRAEKQPAREGDGARAVDGPERQAGRVVAAAADDPLTLKVGYRTYLVAPDAIRWVEAAGDYVRVHTDERVLRVRETMKDFHARVGRGRFVRIHRSTIVNVGFVREIQPYFHGDHVAILRDGTELRIPRSRKQALRRLLGGSEG